MVNISTLFLGLIGSVAMVSATNFNKGNVYWHNCGNCKCADVGRREGWTGTTGCIKISTSVRALGLTSNGILWPDKKMTTCSLFTDDNCQNEAQSVGVAGNNKYACTALNQDTRSIKCYHNV